MRELPLIIFTLAMQAAIGAVLWAALIRLQAKQAPAFKTNTLVALILNAVGIAASLVHLGKPYLALTSMFNLFSSWLSREIFFSGAFFVLLLLFWWLERSNKPLKNVAEALACLAGIASIFTMAQLYMNTIIPSWQSANTLVDFYATAIALGAVVFYLSAGKSARAGLPRLDFVILAVVFLQAAFLPNYLTTLGAMGGAGQASAALLSGGYGIGMFLRWLLLFGGILLLIISRTGKFLEQAGFLYLAATLLIVGEFVGRYLFYASHVPIGIGI